MNKFLLIVKSQVKNFSSVIAVVLCYLYLVF